MLRLALMYDNCMQKNFAAEKYYLITINECNNAMKIDFDIHKSRFTKIYGYYRTNKLIAIDNLAK